MEFFIFIVVVVILLLLFNLRGRVRKLELLIKGKVAQHSSEVSHELQSEQSEVQQPEISGPLLDYIKQQLEQNVDKEKIKSTLLSNGWQIFDIEKAFNFINSSAQLGQSEIGTAQDRQVSVEKFFDWLKEDWLVKLGALLLLIGFGWLTTYAFLNNWIGPMGRIAIGIIAGVFIILLGWWRIKKYINQGGIFLVLGSTTILLTLFAAREVYDFFTPISVLVVMFLSTAFVALASVKYNSRSLALASLVLAGIAPLLTNSPSTDYVGIFLYLLVTVVGAIWIVALTGMRELTAAALILISFYSLPHLMSFSSSDKGVLLLFAYAFAVIFFLTNTAGILKLKDKKIISDLITAAGNGLFLLAWIMAAAQDEWKSLIISAWMIVFLIGAFLVFKITQKQKTFYVYAGIGIAMLAAATSAELNGATLVIAYTIECGIISLITYLFLRDIKIAERINLLLIGPIILSTGSITSGAWATGVIHKDFFVLLVLGLTLFWLGLFFLPRLRTAKDEEPRLFNATLLIVGSIYLYVLFWLSLRAAFLNEDTAVMFCLIIYTIIGLISYFYGFINEKKAIRLYGGLLLGFVIVRLFLVDIWKMELAGRIITFFLIGTLLVSTAFIGKNKHNSNLPDNTQ